MDSKAVVNVVWFFNLVDKVSKGHPQPVLEKRQRILLSRLRHDLLLFGANDFDPDYLNYQILTEDGKAQVKEVCGLLYNNLHGFLVDGEEEGLHGVRINRYDVVKDSLEKYQVIMEKQLRS